MDIFCRIPTEYDKRLAEKLGSPTIFVTSMVEAWKKDMGIKDPDRVPTEKEFEDYIKKTKKETKLLYDTTKKLDNEVSINIYAGTNESTDLSNFAERPFVFKLKDYQYLNELPQDTTFKTVEHAFQALKWDSQLALDNPNTGAILNRIEKILKAPTAAKARELGKMTDIPFDTKIWDEKSSYMMKDIIKASFEQNPQALQLLLSTGNATLTHSQDESTWKTEFPKLLMEVREELRGSSLGISPTKVGTLEPATSLNDEESSVIDRKTEEVIETHTTLEQDLGGGKEAKTEIKDAVMVAKKGMSFEEALAGQETFFTKEEQDQIKQGLNGKNLQVMSVSRLTDPAFFSKEIVTFLEQNAKKELSDPTRVNEDGTLKDNIYTRTGKRPSYTLHSGGADGSDSYWGEVGKRYGVKQNHYYRGRKTPTGDTPQSDEDYKEGYEKAKKAAESMGRTWVEKYANLQARNWNQVKYADAIFAIGHLVKPGEKNKKGYEVTAVQVDGGTGYAVQMAMTENKPVYVFDQERNQWYKHIDGKWSSSETPVLTSNFAGIGTRELNDNGKIAIEEVYAKTFNASGQSVQTQQPALSRKQAIKEVVEKNMEKAKEMEGTSLTSTKYYDKDRIESPELKAVRDFTPAQRRNRVGNIVFFFNMHYGTFASMVEKDIQEKLEQLNAADQEDPEVRAGISILKDQLAKIGDSVDSPDFDLHFVLSYIGVEKIKEVIRKEFEDSLNNGPSRLQKRMLQKQGISEDHFNDMMRKSVENFDILFTDALPAIEKMTGIRIVESMEANADGYSREENDEDNDSSLGDHEDQKVADMQLTYKIKKLNVHDTLSKKVRKLFGTLVKEKQVTDEETGDTKWEIDWDDTGMQQYIDPDLIHLTLLQEFNYMQSPDDFAEKVTENGKQHYKLKAFEKIRDKYPWVPAVLRRLITDVDSEDSMIPLLYSDLQKEYVKYSVIKGSQPLEINKPISEKFLLSQVRQNIEQGNILDGDSIYNSDGSLNAENVDKLKAQIGDDYTVDQMNAYLKEVAKRLRMIGFNINANDLTSLYPEDEAQRKRNKGYAGSDVKDEDVNARKPSYEATVLERELKNFYMYKDNILRAMTSQDRKPLYGASAASKIYENIAKVLGVITDAHASVQCVEKGITYQNYVVPCYINTKIEKILQDPTRTEAIDMEARQQFMDEEYKKYEWFYDHKNNRWRNPLFEMLYKESSNPNVRNLSIDTKDMVQINPADTDNNRNKKGNDYDNWTPENIYTASLVEFADNYFAPKQRGRYVWYSGPILSDSPVAKFYKLPYFNSEKSLNNREGNKKLLELYRALAKQEIWRINECLARQDNPHAQLIGSFDTKGRGTKFCFLECLNPYRNELLDMVNKGNMSEADALIDREVEKYINGEAEKLYGRIGNNGTVMSLLKEKYEKWAGQEVSPEDMEKAAKKMILDFAWNHNLAQANIYQLAITDIAYYKNDTDLQKRFKEIYAAGTKLFTSSKYGREFERTIYLRDIERPSRFLNGIRNVLNKAVESGRMTKGEAAAVIKKFHSMNLADAQAFRTLSSYRSVLDMAGLWDKRMQRTFERITAQKATMDDFMTIYQTIKPFMYTQVEKPTQTGDGCLFKVPHQNKNSEFLLMALYSATSTFSQSPMMRGLNDFMEANQIDVVQFESAVKSGAQGTVDIGVVPAKMANLIKKGLEEKDTAKAIFARAFTKGAKWDNTMESRCNSDTFNKALDEVFKKMPNVDENAVNELCDTVAPNEEEVKEILERYCFKKNADGSLVMEGEGEDKKPVFDECVVHSLPYADYCIQQPTPEHLMDTKSILGSQFKNLIIANLPDGFTAKLHGKEYNKKDLVHLFQMLQTENLLEDFSKLRKEFGDIHKLRAFLLPMVQGSNKYGSDVEAALKIVKHGDKEVFNIPLDNPTTREKLERLMLSCFKNRITKQYIKGGNAILVSSVGYTKELRIRYKADGSWEGVECYLPAYSRKFYAPLLKKVKQADGSTVEILDPSKLDDNLRKAIGYRIPTEEKYSMVPLIIQGFLPQQNGSAIMYPAEMMTLSGEDCDVDKKFLILPEFRMVKYKYAKAAKDFGGDIKAGDIEKMLHQGKTEEDIEKAYPEFYAFLKEHKRDYKYRAAKAMKIKYDVTKDPKDNTREQRNNMIFDICYNILASQSSVADMHNPGNFDKLKRERNMAFVWDSEENIKNFCEYAEQEAGVNLGFRTEKQAKELAAFLEKADDKLLSNFYDKYRRSQDPLSLATFEYFHNQNTTGGKLIGVYAVNTVAHAKFQHLGVHLTDKYTFRVNGHLMEDLSRMANDYGETISFNCAQFSAASVDNVKDPVLADLMQNMDTAGIAGLMVRLGMSVHEVCALFTYPIIKDHIRSFGKLDPEDLLDKASGELPELDAIDLDINQIISDGIRISADSKVLDTDADVRKRMNEVLVVMANLSILAQSMRELVAATRADSPNGAAAISTAGAYIQVRRTKILDWKKSKPAYPFVGARDVIQSGLFTGEETADQLREMFENLPLPAMQAYYTLGVESTNRLLRGYFLTNNPVVESRLDTLGHSTKNCTLGESHVNAYIKDMMLFRLSMTKMFGNDPENHTTYDEKREFYTQIFPMEFIKFVQDKDNAEIINQVPSLRKIIYENGRLQMPDGAGLSRTYRDALKRDFDIFLGLAPDEAQKLFMYAYYAENLKFGPSCINPYFSSFFLASFPEYIDTLRGLEDELSTLPEWLERYDLQFAMNHKSAFAKIPSKSKFVKFDPNDRNKAIVSEDVGINIMGVPYKYVIIGKNLWEYVSYSFEQAEVIYSKITPFEGYNAYLTPEELAEQNKTDNTTRKVLSNIHTQDIFDYENVSNEYVDYIDYSKGKTKEKKKKDPYPAPEGKENSNEEICTNKR